MKRIFFLFACIFTILIAQNGFSQSNKLSFSLFGGYSIPTGDLKGDIIYNSTGNDATYLQSNGFNFGGAFKYALDRTGALQLVVSVDYNAFSNSKDTTETIVIQGGKGTTTTSRTGKIKMNILSANVGAQYNLMPNHKLNPYINLDFTNNFISGDFTSTSNSTTTGGITTTSTSTGNLKSAWRGGLQFGAGIDFAVSPNIGIIVGGNYNLANLIGKDSASSSTANEYTLMDKETTIGSVTTAAKNISYLQLYAGISIYMNRKLLK